jgi:hypothetical protein
VNHNSNEHHDITMSGATSMHSSEGHDGLIMPIATRKHSSDEPMTSSCPSLLCFSYFNELVKSFKMYLNPFSNG